MKITVMESLTYIMSVKGDIPSPFDGFEGQVLDLILGALGLTLDMDDDGRGMRLLDVDGDVAAELDHEGMFPGSVIGGEDG